MLRIALVVVVASLAGCYLAHEPDGSASCTPMPVGSPCTAWQPAGPPIMVSGRSAVSGDIRLTSAVATQCGVLAAWYTFTGRPSPMTLAFETRSLAWSGEPTAAIRPHPSLTVTTNGTGSMQLAAGGSSLAALVSTSPRGCRFVPLDASGVERAPIVSVAPEWCTSLEAIDGGFSFFALSTTGTTPGTLVIVDMLGAHRSATTLAMPMGRALWRRTQFSDQSFLLYSFHEDLVTTRYTGWLQHFDVNGAALAPEVPVTENAVPVLSTPTPDGALTLWETATSGGLPVQMRPVDRDGRPTAGTRDVPASGAQYGAVLASAPGGDVLAAWLEDHFRETPSWRLRVQALAPDGSARGAPTSVLTGVNAGGLRILIDASGERALALYDEEGVRALPLACVH